MNKRCCTCREMVPLALFVLDSRKKDGHGYQCKKCHRSTNLKWSKKNREKVRECSAKHYRENKESYKQRVKAWRKANPTIISIIKKDYRNRHKNNAKFQLMEKAWNKVHYAIVGGKLPKASYQICSACKSKQAQEYHHHNGYSKEHWLDVVPVCFECHIQLR